jgi:hypothetical protein
MKNKLVLLSLFLFCLYGPIWSQDIKKKKTDIEEGGLFGKVKQVKLNCFAADEKSGNAIEDNRCDDNNYLIIYNDKGNAIEVSVHSSGWRNEKKLFKYDNDRNLIELNIFDASNDLSGSYKYNYDVSGNKTGSKYYGTDNSFKKRESYKYDNKGNAIEQIEYNSNDRLILRHVYKYDGKGNQVESSTYSSLASLEERYTHKYDDKGNRIETNAYDSNGNLESKGTWTYDKYNNPIQNNWFNKKGVLSSAYRYEYEYDQQGNWIKKIEFEKNVPQKVILREIIYFR